LETEISSPFTPDPLGTSVCTTAPVAGFSRTMPPLVVAATIPGSMLVLGVLADGDAAPSRQRPRSCLSPE
jgi:hypothetical protein